LQSLAEAASMESANRRYQYVYAVALQSMGQAAQGIQVLEQLYRQQPIDMEILYALVTFNRDVGDREKALAYAVELQALMPDNSDISSLIEGLKNDK